MVLIFWNFNARTTPDLSLNKIKIQTSADIPKINGTVTPMQKGQHGPAMTQGLPSPFSIIINIFPTRLAQQQKYA